MKWRGKLIAIFMGALFCALSIPAQDEGGYLVNLLTNPDFTADVDRDDVPDYWIKPVRSSEGFHPYGRVMIDKDPSSGTPSVRLEPNGTNVALENHDTVLIKVNPNSSYHLSAKIQTENCAQRSVQAGLGVLWLDKDLNVLEDDWVYARHENKDGSRPTTWQKLVLDTLEVPLEAQWVRVRFGLFHHPDGLHGVSVDGRGWFKNFYMTRRPRVYITPESSERIFPNKKNHLITFRILGLEVGNYRCYWSVTNFLNQEIDSGGYEIEARRQNQEHEREIFLNLKKQKGWFKLSMRLESLNNRRTVIARESRIFGVGPEVNELGDLHISEEVGIDLQAKEMRDSVDVVGDLVEHTRTRHVTLTLWNSQFDTRKPLPKTYAGQLVGRMNEANVRLHAVLGYIPHEIQGEFLGSTLFSFLSARKAQWEPILKKTGKQYSEIDSWVIGSELDTSLVEQGPLSLSMVRDTRKTLSIPGMKLGLPIGTLYASNEGKSFFPRVFKDVDFFTFIQPTRGQQSNDYMDLNAFDELLKNPNDEFELQESSPKKKYVRLELRDQTESIGDRVDSMVFGTIHLLARGADRVYFKLQPSSPTGLVDHKNDFLPEFFVFRTLTNLMAPVKILGEIDLPSRSGNLILEFHDNRGSRLAMIVWNKKNPVTEDIFLGDRLKLLDLMGNHHPLKPQDGINKIPVSSIPNFLVDMDEELMRTRLSVILGRPVVDSRTQEIRNSIEITNFLNENLSGTLELSLPKGWQVLGDGKFKIPTMKTGDRRIVSFTIQPDSFETTSKDVPINLKFTFDGNTRPPMTIFKRFRFESRTIEARFQFSKATKNVIPVQMSVRNIGGGQIDLIAYNATLGRQESARFLGLLRPGDNQVVTFNVFREDIENNRVTLGVRENGGFGRFVNRQLRFVEGELIDVE